MLCALLHYLLLYPALLIWPVLPIETKIGGKYERKAKNSVCIIMKTWASIRSCEIGSSNYAFNRFLKSEIEPFPWL